MLRPPTARLTTVTSPVNRAPNWLPQPTGQPPDGFCMVESPAIQILIDAAATARAGTARSLDESAAAALLDFGGQGVATKSVSRTAALAEAVLRAEPAPSI